jgi:hypothetical protein
MADDKSAEDLKALNTVLANTQVLVASLSASLKNPAAAAASTLTSQSAEENPINPLHLAHDAASLLKAHSTKLSLLLLNPPFTPTAVTKVLRESGAQALPALATAAQLCTKASYTEVVSTELKWRVGRLLDEFGKLLKDMPRDGSGKVVAPEAGKVANANALPQTGVVWNAADQVMALKSVGIAGLLVKKAEQWRDTLKDAIEELQEWAEEEADDEDEAEDDEDEGNSSDETYSTNAAQQMVDDLFNSGGSIPRNDPDRLRPRVEKAVRKLKLLSLLYTAVSKRRFKTVPAATSVVVTKRIDDAVNILKTLPPAADELASAFYDLDAEEVDKRLKACEKIGSKAADKLASDWNGGDDEFTEWAEKFKAQLKN